MGEQRSRPIGKDGDADPMLGRTITLVTVLQVIASLKIFDQVYLITQGGTISIYNSTAGQTVVRSDVPPQTVVRVDATGVYFNQATVVSGPLGANQTYELRLEH